MERAHLQIDVPSWDDSHLFEMLPTSPRPSQEYDVDAVPRLTTFARGYMHLFEMHTTSPRPKICTLFLTTSQALFA